MVGVLLRRMCRSRLVLHPPSTLNAWLKNKDAIKAMFEAAPAASSRELNVSAVYFTKIEQAVLK